MKTPASQSFCRESKTVPKLYQVAYTFTLSVSFRWPLQEVEQMDLLQMFDISSLDNGHGSQVIAV